MFTQCTIEKRLYNNGYHIERKHSFTSTIIEEQTPSSEMENKTKTPIQLRSSKLDIQDQQSQITDPREENVLLKDSVYVGSTSTKGWDSQRKKEILLEIGGATLATGIAAGALLSKATAAGASLSAVTILGPVGWVLAVSAAILLILFIIFLFVPVNDKVVSKKSNLSRGERAALTILISIFGVVGLAFLLTSLMD